MNCNRFARALLVLAVACLSLFATGCKGTEGFQSPIVGVVDGKIDGTMRWNGRYVFIRGAFDGQAKLVSTFGGMLLAEPQTLAGDEWLLLDITSMKVVARGKLGVPPLIPAHVRGMFAPEELNPTEGPSLDQFFEPIAPPAPAPEPQPETPATIA